MSDFDAFNHVLAALKELIAVEGIQREEDMDLHLNGGLIKAIADYRAVVRKFGVSISPDVPLARLEPAPERFEDLLPKKAEQDDEDDLEYDPKPIVRAAKLAVPPQPAEPGELEDYDEHHDDMDVGENMNKLFASPTRADEAE